MQNELSFSIVNRGTFGFGRPSNWRLEVGVWRLVGRGGVGGGETDARRAWGCVAGYMEPLRRHVPGCSGGEGCLKDTLLSAQYGGVICVWRFAM